jgi:hypothetical protein
MVSSFRCGRGRFVADAVDFIAEGIELVLSPRRFGDQRGHHLLQRTAEEGLQILLEGRPLGGGGGNSG